MIKQQLSLLLLFNYYFKNLIYNLLLYLEVETIIFFTLSTEL